MYMYIHLYTYQVHTHTHTHTYIHIHTHKTCTGSERASSGGGPMRIQSGDTAYLLLLACGKKERAAWSVGGGRADGRSPVRAKAGKLKQNPVHGARSDSPCAFVDHMRVNVYFTGKL
jgi:hypothetical protein